jgi:hypothetical protein
MVNEVAFMRGTRLLVTGFHDKSFRVWRLTEKQVDSETIEMQLGS